jgi:hypothetical protein
VSGGAQFAGKRAADVASSDDADFHCFFLEIDYLVVVASLVLVVFTYPDGPLNSIAASV